MTAGEIERIVGIGVEAARAAGLGPVKVNAVLMRGVNDQEAPVGLSMG